MESHDRHPNTLLFLDTETTGITEGRLIQVAYKARGPHAEDDAMHVEYFKPPVPIEIEAMAVHHITEKHIAAKPAFGGSAAHAALKALLTDPATVLVAHNAKFDIGILSREGLPLSSCRYVCTMKIAMAMYDLPHYKMQYLRYLWGIEDDGATAHDAEGDVAILEKVFGHMLGEYMKTNGMDEARAIDAFVEISKQPTLLRRMNFGKYAGRTFAEVASSDRSYLEWLSSLGDKGEDFIYTVKHYLETKA
jgi:DNA polymerase III epsilon subunit-like protein